PAIATVNACADGAAADSDSDVAAFALLVTTGVIVIHGRIPLTSMMRKASDWYGPDAATCTLVTPVTVFATRAAGAAQTAQRVTPAAALSPPGAPRGSHQLWASS